MTTHTWKCIQTDKAPTLPINRAWSPENFSWTQFNHNQNHNHHNYGQEEQFELKEMQSGEPEQLLNKPNYARKRSILRKLMIAQRQQFLYKKEQAEFNKLKNNLADTSISNFSQASGHIEGGEGEKKLLMNEGGDTENNMK